MFVHSTLTPITKYRSMHYRSKKKTRSRGGDREAKIGRDENIH